MAFTPLLSPIEFQGVGDGSHDDTSAILATITAATLRQADTIFLPKGNWVFNATPGTVISLPAGVRIRGAGQGLTTLTINNPVTNSQPLNLNGYNELNDFTLLWNIPNAANPASSCLGTVQGNDNVIKRVKIAPGLSNYWFPNLFQPAADIEGLLFEQVRVENFPALFWSQNGTTVNARRIAVMHSYFTGMQGNCLIFNHPSNTGVMEQLLVQGCTFKNMALMGSGVSQLIVSFAGEIPSGAVRDCTFDGFQAEAVHIEDRAHGIVIDHNIFKNYGNTDTSITYGAVNIIGSSTGSAIDATRGIKVENNLFDSTGYNPAGTNAAGSAYQLGISVSAGGGTYGPYYVQVYDNTFIADTTGKSKTLACSAQSTIIDYAGNQHVGQVNSPVSWIWPKGSAYTIWRESRKNYYNGSMVAVVEPFQPGGTNSTPLVDLNIGLTGADSASLAGIVDPTSYTASQALKAQNFSHEWTANFTGTGAPQTISSYLQVARSFIGRVTLNGRQSKTGNIHYSANILWDGTTLTITNSVSVLGGSAFSNVAIAVSAGYPTGHWAVTATVAGAIGIDMDLEFEGDYYA